MQALEKSNVNFWRIKRGSVQLVTSHLHPNDGVDEEQHGDKQADVWQGLKTNKDSKMS